MSGHTCWCGADVWHACQAEALPPGATGKPRLRIAPSGAGGRSDNTRQEERRGGRQPQPRPEDSEDEEPNEPSGKP